MGLFLKSFSIFKRDIVLFFTNLLTGIAVGRVIGPEALGIWGILSLVPAYAESFGRIKVDIAAVFYISRKEFLEEDIYRSINLIAIISSFLIILGILVEFDLIYNYLFKYAKSNFRFHLFVLLLQIPLQFLYLNHAYFFIAHERIDIYNKIVLIQSLMNSALSIIFLFFTSLGIWSVIISAISGTFFALLFGIYSIDKKAWNKFNIKREVNIKLLHYGFKLYINGILGQLQQSGTQLLSVQTLFPSQIAFLNQSQGLGRILFKLVDPLNTILFPSISKSNINESIKLVCFAFRISTLLLSISGIGFLFICKPLILILYGPNFLPTVVIIYYLIPGLVINAACSTLISYYNGIGKAGMIPLLNLFSILIQLILTIYLSQLFGLIGAAISISIGLSLSGLSLLFIFSRKKDVSILDLLPRYTDMLFLIYMIKKTILNDNKKQKM
jgi:O-antigen/teichoic acid export membrane protein